jgi:hypothetical protein
MSTTEAEYRALAEGTKEAVHLKQLLEELEVLSNVQVPLTCSDKQALTNLKDAQFPTKVDITLNSDNVSAIKLARNPVFHACIKHIELHHHYIRERILAKEIDVKYINTDVQPADILTKPLGQAQFEKHRERLSIVSIKDL